MTVNGQVPFNRNQRMSEVLLFKNQYRKAIGNE